MGYKKLVQSGDLVELYEYQYDYIKRRSKGEGKVVGRCSKVRNRRADNLYRLRKRFTNLVRSNLTRGQGPMLLTFTMFEVVSVGVAYRVFTKFIQRLRGRYGKTFKYVAVPEFQKRGAVHFHMLGWGFPINVYNEEKYTRSIQWLWRYGYVDIIQTDGSVKLAGYLGKYLFKSLSDERLLAQKAYVASRNILRPVSYASPSAHEYVELLVNGWQKGRVQVKMFNTKWLGSCRYSRYELV